MTRPLTNRIEKTVSEIATCKECDWESQDRNAASLAWTHYVMTGHAVHGNRTTAFSYSKSSRKGG